MAYRSVRAPSTWVKSVTYPSVALPDVPAPPLSNALLRILRSLAVFASLRSTSQLDLRMPPRNRIAACAERDALTRTIAYNLLVNLILRLLCHDPALENILPFWRSGATSWEGEGHWAWFGHWLYGSRRSSSESGQATRPYQRKGTVPGWQINFISTSWH
jgi:hypothetical protein